MSTQADGEDPDWNNENAPSNVSGGIEVILRNVLPTEGIVLNVWLEKDGQAAGDTRQVQLEKSAKGRSEIFEGLDEGTYSLKITGSYNPYLLNITDDKFYDSRHVKRQYLSEYFDFSED